MNGEVLSLQTAEKLQRIDKVINYIDDKIDKSFKADMGISGRMSDRLMTETVIELQIIESMLKGNDKDERIKED